MKRIWNPSDEKNFISCFDEANKSWVGFINSKYRAEAFCVLWSTIAGVRLVGRTHTGAGWSEAHGFKQIGVELQGSLLHLREDLRCDLSSNLLSYAVLCFSNNYSQPSSVFTLVFCWFGFFIWSRCQVAFAIMKRRVSNFKRMAGHYKKAAAPYHKSLETAQNDFMLNHPEIRSLWSEEIVHGIEAKMYHFAFGSA